ncbi:hypothetical protein [Paenibacillus rhizoplanae]|uniref:hypothetical protein n=1 Tax=Paenibacillus rhizoplanae TaxID=1917181 RepID=UPI00361394AE
MDNLASNNSILDQTFQLSPVGMAVWSPEGGRWMKINPAFCNMLGCTETEFLSGTLSGLAGFFKMNSLFSESGQSLHSSKDSLSRWISGSPAVTGIRSGSP